MKIRYSTVAGSKKANGIKMKIRYSTVAGSKKANSE